VWAGATSLGCLPRLEREDEPDPSAVRPVDLADLLARAGRTTGRADELDAIEAAVVQLLDNARAATGKRGIALPASVATAPVRVAPVLDAAFCDNEVLIARERVRVSHGHGCFIVCPGAVEVSHGSRNVIVAGQLIDVGFDNAGPGGLWGSPDRSVLVCGRELHVSHAYDTLFVSPAGSIAHAHRVTFAGRSGAKCSHGFWCRHLDGPAIVRSPAPVADPLAGRVERAELLYDGPSRAFRLHARAGPASYDLAQGEAPADGPMAGWRVVYCGSRPAVLYNGRDWSLLTPRKPPEPPRR
jgi:hypothetical protein